MNVLLYIIIGIMAVAGGWWFIRHQRKLRLRAHLMQEAIRNKDFTFRMPTDGMIFGERAMQETLNQLGETIRQQVNQSEVESWERLTRVLTHEMMNATAPITSISQSLLNRPDVKSTPLEDGIQAIYDTSRHLSDFVISYRKMSELEKPKMGDVALLKMIEDIRKAYPQLTWEVNISPDMTVWADAGMLRQVLMNLVKNAIEAQAQKIVVEAHQDDRSPDSIQNHGPLIFYIGNDGLPIPAENRQSLFVPFFTTKRSGSGIGLSLSRRMMVLQGGMLELAEQSRMGCRVAFLLSLPRKSTKRATTAVAITRMAHEGVLFQRISPSTRHAGKGSISAGRGWKSCPLVNRMMSPTFSSRLMAADDSRAICRIRSGRSEPNVFNL